MTCFTPLGLSIRRVSELKLWRGGRFIRRTNPANWLVCVSPVHKRENLETVLSYENKVGYDTILAQD